jgi:hypothetical protein
MWEASYNLLERRGTWPVVALLFLLFILCAQAFEYRRNVLGYENQALDSRRWYSPSEARDFLKAIEKQGRRVYAATELTLDILFPIVYGALFSILLIRVYPPQSAKNLVIVPLLTAAADVLENLTAAYLALQFNGETSSVARVAAVFTAAKSILLVLSLILILVGALATLRRTSRFPT